MDDRNQVGAEIDWLRHGATMNELTDAVPGDKADWIIRSDHCLATPKAMGYAAHGALVCRLGV